MTVGSRKSYGYEKLDQNISITNDHDEDFVNRINDVIKKTNWLANCLHCGTYAFHNNWCLAGKSTGEANA